MRETPWRRRTIGRKALIPERSRLVTVPKGVKREHGIDEELEDAQGAEPKTEGRDHLKRSQRSEYGKPTGKKLRRNGGGHIPWRAELWR